MELWDLYDRNKNLTGKTHERGTWISDGYYHLVVRVWLKNKEGKYLVSKRDENRIDYPLLYECPGGSVLKGEDSITGARRETLEEVGVDLSNIDGKLIYTLVSDKYHVIEDTWLFYYDDEVDLSKATEKEVSEVKWMTKEKIEELSNNGKFVPGLFNGLKIGDK